MTKIFKFVLALSTLSTCFAQTANLVRENDAVWLLHFKTTKPHTPEAVNDQRFAKMLRSHFRQSQNISPNASSVPVAISDFLAVHSEDAVVIKNRFVSFSGCVQHRCPEHEGFLWIDTDGPRSTLVFVALTAMPQEPITSASPSKFHAWVFVDREFKENSRLPEQFLIDSGNWFRQFKGRSLLSATLIEPTGQWFPLLPETLHFQQTQEAN